jgi:FkbM family methyltransferase
MKLISGLLDLDVLLHSQPATQQDKWVIETLRDKKGQPLTGGYFVECGINDGLQHSNTLTLEHYFGWNGLLVEADPALSTQARENRPDCQHATFALSCTNDSVVRFTRGGQWGGLTAFLPDAWRREAAARHAEEIWVTTRTLASLLVWAKAPSIIDYLSLDIEGAEVSVLQEFFDGGRPTHRFRCLTVEYRQEAAELMRLHRILEPHGYVLDHTQAWDAMFINQSLVSST